MATNGKSVTAYGQDLIAADYHHHHCLVNHIGDTEQPQLGQANEQLLHASSVPSPTGAPRLRHAYDTVRVAGPLSRAADPHHAATPAHF
jgi:hypothetical protein